MLDSKDLCHQTSGETLNLSPGYFEPKEGTSSKHKKQDKLSDNKKTISQDKKFKMPKFNKAGRIITSLKSSVMNFKSKSNLLIY
jgi:hypothetical protein